MNFINKYKPTKKQLKKALRQCETGPQNKRTVARINELKEQIDNFK